MKRQCELKVFKSGSYEYIYVYYKYRQGIIRINTNNKYIKSYMNADLSYNDKMKDSLKLNQRTERLLEKVNQYIFSQWQGTYPSISQKKCLDFIDTLHYDTDSRKLVPIVRQTTKKSTVRGLTEYLQEFIEYKKKELYGNYQSYYKYIAVKLALLKYQKHRKMTLTFDNITPNFMIDFRDFLCSKLKHNDNIVFMRLNSLKTFLRWVMNQNLYEFKTNVFNISGKTYHSTIVTLNDDDIRVLLKLKLTDKKQQKVLDFFCLNLFLGLRHSDLRTIIPTDFVEDNGRLVLVKVNQKTGITVRIPVTDRALTILKKYGFTINAFSNESFNTTLKTIFEEQNLFSEPIQYQRKQGGKQDSKIVMRRDMIRSHTGRRTFVTRAVNTGIALTTIQQATGHLKLSTLEGYVNKNQSNGDFDKTNL